MSPSATPGAFHRGSAAQLPRGLLHGVREVLDSQYAVRWIARTEPFVSGPARRPRCGREADRKTASLSGAFGLQPVPSKLPAHAIVEVEIVRPALLGHPPRSTDRSPGRGAPACVAGDGADDRPARGAARKARRGRCRSRGVPRVDLATLRFRLRLGTKRQRGGCACKNSQRQSQFSSHSRSPSCCSRKRLPSAPGPVVQCPPPKTSSWIGMISTSMRSSMAWTSPTASTTCSASALPVLSLPEAIASWLLE